MAHASLFESKCAMQDEKSFNFFIFLIETRVELPIIKHVPIIKHFPIFFSFVNQIE
jgi:hypothetical protein